MPYIEQNDRKEIDQILDIFEDIECFLAGYPIQKRQGVVNYIISTIVAQNMKPDEGWNYSSLSRALATFSDAEHEMRRQLMDPYEDKKIQENGGLPEYA